MESFEHAKAYLKKADPEGRTLYDHLAEVLLVIAKEKPEQPLHDFESISARVKQTTVKPKYLKEFVVPPANASAAVLSAIQKVATLCKPVPKTEEEEESANNAENVNIPDLLQENGLLEWGGVSLPREETYKLLLSIHQFAKQNSQLASVRLFGKVLGLQKDYIVLEAKLNEYPEPDETETNKLLEPLGKGANEYVYFVSNDATETWTQLPAVTPEQVKLARQVRRFFTGDLKAPVFGYPRFPWPEASYLRAQIARIVAATAVAPAGFYVANPDDEEGDWIQNEEFKGLPANDLKTAENWAHSRRGLLNNGRYAKIQVEPSEDEENEHLPTEEEKEEEIPTGRALNEDTGACWSFRVAPNPSPADSSAFPHAVSVAQSLLWPGAVSVVQSTKVVNFYVGYGLKYLGGKSYIPPPIPTIQSEYVLKVASEEEEEAPSQELKEQTDPLPPPPEPEVKNDEENAGSQTEEQNEEQQDEE